MNDNKENKKEELKKNDFLYKDGKSWDWAKVLRYFMSKGKQGETK